MNEIRNGRIIPNATICFMLVGALLAPGDAGRAKATQALIAADAVQAPLAQSQPAKPPEQPKGSKSQEQHESPAPRQESGPVTGSDSKPQSVPAPAHSQPQGKSSVAPPGQTGSKSEPALREPAPVGNPPAGVQPAPAPTGTATFHLENADLLQFIGIIASELKLNYVVDPAVKGAVTINTTGVLPREDLFPILETVLKINGATAIETGNFYRIIPSTQAAKTPVKVFSESSLQALPQDERMVMQIVPLRFVFASDIAKMITPFLSDGGTVAVHEAANTLILVDTGLNVRRLNEIIEQFDSVAFAQQRVHIVPVENNVASGLVPELESIFSAYALAEKSTPLRFVPIDRINAILVVTPDPSAFEEVDKWVQKLDQPAPPSGIQTFTYRVQNSEADYLARLLRSMQGHPESSPASRQGGSSGSAAESVPQGSASQTREMSTPTSEFDTGRNGEKGVRITVDPVNNTLIIQSTAQQYSEILNTLKQLDVLPRQVMIEARVYEVTLSGDLSFGVEYFLQQKSSQERKPLGSFTAKDGLQASAGFLIGQTRELMMFLHASDNRTRVKVISSPTVLATDNFDARIQVGSEIPILTSQGVVPVQSGGSSLFTNTIQNRDTGIILTVTPRITSTGLVSLRINQEISSAQPPPGGGIQSPSFLKRMLQTRAVVGDNETIALGGLIQDSITTTRNRIPLLGDIPYVGALFGSTSETTAKTELIILLTPHIIKSIEEARDATRELRDSLTDLRRGFQKDKTLPFRTLDNAR